MKRRILVWVWRLANILACVLLGALAVYEYLTLVFCRWADSGDLLMVLMLAAVPVLGGGYHLYRLFRPVAPGKIAAGWRRILRTVLLVPAEACVLVGAWPVFYTTAMGFGERIYFYQYAVGPNYASAIVLAEKDFHEAKGTYTDKLEDLSGASTNSSDWFWLGPKAGYDARLSVVDGGTHFTAVVTAKPERKLKRDGYYVDDSGTVRSAPEGMAPDKNSRVLFTGH